MPSITDLIPCVRAPDCNVTLVKTCIGGDTVWIRFVIRDTVDGSRFWGERGFAHDTQFADLTDLEQELWLGELNEIAPEANCAETKASLWWAVAAIAVVTPVSHLAHYLSEAANSVPVALFVSAVVTLALVFGTRVALAAAALAPVAYNLFVIAPYHAFTVPTPRELVMAAFYVALAIGVPLVHANLGWVRQRAQGIEISCLRWFGATSRCR